MTLVLEARRVTLAGRLRPTDLMIRSGELVALMGPNGSGKTSLLRTLAGIEQTEGTVRIGGEELGSVPFARRPLLMTFLPASREVVWPISARDVIVLGLPSPDPARADELIGMFELEPLADRPIDCLSTGERARVLLARALAPKPRLLLLDEPLSNLDPYWVLRLLDILRQTVLGGSAALVALHDIDRISVFDRALLVDQGELCADLEPAQMLASQAVGDAFRIEGSDGAWRIRLREDRRSSP